MFLAVVDVSSNPNPFNFWTAEYEYIKKTGIWMFYTQKLTTPILALKLSVSAIISPRWTATAIEYEYNYPVRDMDLSPMFVQYHQ